MIDDTATRSLLSRHGEVRAQSLADWVGPFPVPSSLESYYRDIGPANVEIAAYGNPCFVPSLAELWNFQAGYRWNGLNGEPIDGWNDDWLVVADQGGDPFIVSRSSGIVSHAFHGGGTWNAVELFTSPSTMVASLAELGRIVLDRRGELVDVNGLIRTEIGITAIQSLERLLNSQSKAEAVLVRLGWL